MKYWHQPHQIATTEESFYLEKQPLQVSFLSGA